jgi:methylated-DNA-[protein]-cysteine S-methyltransferase
MIGATMTAFWTRVGSPLGPLRVVAADAGVRELAFTSTSPQGAIEDPSALAEVTAQIAAYFAGERRVFDVPLDPLGTDFQRRVWAALREIPWGVTRSYADIAEAVGRPGAARAVGGAVGRNPIAIIVPCHRVVGADGSLTGYASGLARKRRLLEIEGVR